ncbi:MAG: membrane protein insertase YidC [Dysgonamonadaceae bacterium]|jgi:YidC/Oxa1 family membrane protein insertase|nr:membrane protein insertase YidC [Dysgonamonadaceae bacterium]
MERKTILGFVLIFIVLIGFQYLNQPSAEQQKVINAYRDSVAREVALSEAELNRKQATLEVANDVLSDVHSEAKLREQFGDFAASAQGEPQTVILENDLLLMRFSTKGGRVESVELKKFKDYRGNPLILFGENDSRFSATLTTVNKRVINTGDLFFEIVENTVGRVIFRLRATDNDSYLDFEYTLSGDDYMVGFNIIPHNLNHVVSSSAGMIDIRWEQKIRQQEKGRSYENRYAQLYYKYYSDDIDYLSETKDDERLVKDRIKWIGFKDQFFSSVLISGDRFVSGKLNSYSMSETDTVYLKEYIAETSVEFDLEQPLGFFYFFGPNDYDLLKSYDKTMFSGDNIELERLVPLGWSLFRMVNKYIVIPVFGYLNDSGMAIGLAIFLLTLIIKTALFPLTWKSFMSSAKMRVMKPQITTISQKYPGQENAVVRQQKTMELYRQVGINPMAGCLPMLLQMPFLISLFMFFPSAIDLRQQSFLWANDLATYDDIIKLPFSIPFLGSHISLFCLIMTLTNVIYSKFTMEQTSGGQEQMPGMKLMIYVMPLIFLFTLNSFPAGLNYYYFVSSLITILQTLAFRWFIDEKALLTKLEANKKNPPKKKSGFMARLEEAQRKQQQMLKEQQKRNSKRR